MDIMQESRKKFEEWAKDYGYKFDRFGSTSAYANDSTNKAWSAWQAALAASQTCVAKLELPAPPEMESLADLSYAQQTPDDWDADYRATWQKLQVAERNKAQWRSYANDLRAALSASTAPQSSLNKTDLRVAIMNLPCERTMSHFATTDDMRLYREGHCDARYAAAELVASYEAAPQPSQIAGEKDSHG